MRFVLPAFAARERVVGYLGVPLKLGKDVLGVLEVYTREARRFTPDEMRLMITFASQASVGLQNALLVEQAGHRLDDLQAVGLLAEMVAQARPDAELFPAVLRLLGETTRADAGVLRVYAPMNRVDVYRRGGGDEDSREMEALLRDLAAQVENAEGAELVPLDYAMPILVARIPAPPDQPTRGVLILMRAPQRPGFDGHERQLLTTTANLLSACLRGT